MSRRGHQSTKIPNVKLRPAQPQTTNTKKPLDKKRTLAVEDEDENTQGGISRRIEEKRPYVRHAIRLCCTGIREKAGLFSMAKELGCTVEVDLTDAVNLLVAEEGVGEKYKMAVHLGIPVVKSSFVRDSHAAWVRGEELSLATQLTTHKLQPFEKLRLCLSAIEPQMRRAEISEMILARGGTVSKNLDRTVTHLISGVSMSEKISWAQKQNASYLTAKAKGTTETSKVLGGEISIVWDSWFLDCVKMEGRVPEQLYSVEDERREYYTDRLLPLPAILNIVPLNPPLSNKIRIASSTASLPLDTSLPKNDPNLEKAVLNNNKRRRLGNFEEDYLKSMIGDDDTAASTSMDIDSKQQQDEDDEFPMPDKNRRSQTQKKSQSQSAPEASTTTTGHLSRIGSMSRSTSFTMSTKSKLQQTETASHLHTNETLIYSASSSTGIFRGLRFRYKVPPKMVEKLEANIVSQGGAVVKEESGSLEEVDYFVHALSLGKPKTPILNAKNVVSEGWIEQCIYHRDLRPMTGVPGDDGASILFRPLDIEIPVFCADQLRVHISGVSDATRYSLKKVLTIIGATVMDTLSKLKSTHIITHDSYRGEKYHKALSWGIPVMKIDWVWAIVQSGCIEKIGDWTVGDSTKTDKIDRDPPKQILLLPPEGPESQRSRSPTTKSPRTASQHSSSTPLTAEGTKTHIDVPSAAPMTSASASNNKTPSGTDILKEFLNQTKSSTERSRSNSMSGSGTDLSTSVGNVNNNHSKPTRKKTRVLGRKATTPPVTTSNEPSFGDDSSGSHHQQDEDMENQQQFDESHNRIRYDDPEARRERKKLEDALKRSAAAAAASKQ